MTGTPRSLPAAVAGGMPTRPATLAMESRALAVETQIRDSRLVLCGLILVHVFVWTALPLLVNHALPADVVEGLAWGREWQLGYYKHPPLQAWLLQTVAVATGHRAWAYYLLSQIAVALTLWAVWRLARYFTAPAGALVAVLLLDGVLYCNFKTPAFNPDVVQLPLWALAGWSFYRALRFQRHADWCLLGCWLALSCYGKYTTLVLAATMAIFLALDPQARHSLRRPGPYLAAGLGLALLLPHIAWLVLAGFPSLQHFESGATPAGGAAAQLAALAHFAGGQLAMMAPAGLLVLVAQSPRSGTAGVQLVGELTAFDRRFLAMLALGPFLLTLVISAVTALEFRIRWAAPMWDFIGLFAVVFLRPHVTAVGLRRLYVGWAATFAAVAGAYAGSVVLAPYLRQAGWLGDSADYYLSELLRPHFPGPELATEIERRWRARYGTALAFIVGSKWEAGLVGSYGADHPSVYIVDEDLPTVPWIDLAMLLDRGAVVVWNRDGEAADWLSRVRTHFPALSVQPDIRLDWKTGAGLAPLDIGWAIIEPKGPMAPAPRPGQRP